MHVHIYEIFVMLIIVIVTTVKLKIFLIFGHFVSYIFFCVWLERHSACAELCLHYAPGHCSEEHDQYSSNVNEFHKITKEVNEALEGIPDPGKKSSLSKSW